MPPCKNDPSRNYRGTEPSPKGWGWCGHAEKINSTRIGRDGKPWIVKCYNGVKKWIVKRILDFLDIKICKINNNIRIKIKIRKDYHSEYTKVVHVNIYTPGSDIFGTSALGRSSKITKIPKVYNIKNIGQKKLDITVIVGSDDPGVLNMELHKVFNI